jgi:beta-lactamase class A
MKTNRILFTLLMLCTACHAQNKPKDHVTLAVEHDNSALKSQLEGLIKMYKGKVGVAMIAIEDRDSLTINNGHHFPMQSTYKFPLAMAVLQQVDKGKLSLDQKVHITKTDLRETWSPLREKYPDGNIDVTVAELLKYTVSMSDNNTCDILFKLVKGTSAVDHYVQQLGVKNMAIKYTEKEMAATWDVQYKNYSTPYAMAHLLDVFYSGKPLSASSTALLMKLMTESANSDARIKGQLPPEAVVAHKTGTSDTSKEGMTAAINDVGIVTLPDGKHFALAIFLSDSKETKETNEKMIALIAAHVYSALGLRSVGK